jgi:hypothetical protein
MTCKYSCLNFLLHLPGVFGFGLLHYEDGVMGRRASSAEALVAKWGLCKIGGTSGLEDNDGIPNDSGPSVT